MRKGKRYRGAASAMSAVIWLVQQSWLRIETETMAGLMAFQSGAIDAHQPELIDDVRSYISRAHQGVLAAWLNQLLAH